MSGGWSLYCWRIAIQLAQNAGSDKSENNYGSPGAKMFELHVARCSSSESSSYTDATV